MQANKGCRAQRKRERGAAHRPHQGISQGLDLAVQGADPTWMMGRSGHSQSQKASEGSNKVIITSSSAAKFPHGKALLMHSFQPLLPNLDTSAPMAHFACLPGLASGSRMLPFTLVGVLLASRRLGRLACGISHPEAWNCTLRGTSWAEHFAFALWQKASIPSCPFPLPSPCLDSPHPLTCAPGTAPVGQK